MSTLKKFLSLFAAAILCMGLFAFVSCDGESAQGESSQTAATNYTLLVKDANGEAISNLSVGICTYDEATGTKGACLLPVKTDENGKAVIEADEGTYTLNEDLFASTSYSCQEKYVLKAYGEYTIVLVTE